MKPYAEQPGVYRFLEDYVPGVVWQRPTPEYVRRATTGAPFGSAKRGVHLCLECSWCFALLSIHSVVHFVVLYAVSGAFRIFVYLRLVLGERSGQGKKGKGGGGTEKMVHQDEPRSDRSSRGESVYRAV